MDAGVPTLSVEDAAVSEGQAGSAVLSFRVRLSSSSGEAVTVAYATADGTATSGGNIAQGGEDYVSASGTLTFAVGEIEKVVDVTVNGDALDEPDEILALSLTNPTFALLLDADAVGTIQDDDATPTVGTSPVTAAEGTGGTSTATVTIALSAASGRAVDVTYATTAGTAAAGTDFTAASGTLSFAPGELSKTVTITVAPDALDEDDETLTLDLSSPSNATLGQAQALITLTDDDASPTLSVGNGSISEGNTGSASLSLNVTLSAASGRAVSVSYMTADGTAAAGSDYTSASGTLTFAAGETTRSISLAVIGDTASENDETFVLNLSNPVNATLAVSQGTATILNDDTPLPALSIASSSVTEGNSGTVNLSFTVTLSAASASAVTVRYDSADGTAVSTGAAAAGGMDYSASSGTLTIPAGQTTGTISVPVNGDAVFEANETLTMTLSSATNANIATPQATGTINNDEAAPTLAVNDVNTAEGNAGTRKLAFSVSLSGPSQPQVTVDYATADDTAVAAGVTGSGAGDYAASQGTLTFAAGATSILIEVDVNGDSVDEPNETFRVNLTNAANATIADAQGIGAIQDDDAPPAISIDDVGVNEGDTGSSPATFTVSLSAASAQVITVSYQTTQGTGTNAATSGVDYTAILPTTLTFNPGVTTLPVTVQITGDTTQEPNETFTVDLSSPTNATIADGSGLGTIFASDQPSPVFTINDVTVNPEPDTGGTATATLTVTLSMAAASTVTVDYGTTNGTAVAGTDYTAKTGTLSFLAGETSKTVDVVITGDALSEADETFTVNLSNASAGTSIGDGQGLVTIRDNDPLPSLTLTDVNLNEGAAGTTASANFTVTLSQASGQVVKVDYATANDTAVSTGSLATGGQDFVNSSATLTFQPGETSKSVAVTVNGDNLNEPNERFFLNLSNAVAANIGDNQGIGNINNDDPLPSLSIADVTTTEGNSATKAFTFVVTLSAASGANVSVTYATANGTATSGILNDYLAVAATTLTFSPGETTKTLSVNVRGDTTVEPDETFFVNLTNPTGATVTDNQALGTITNDD